MTRFPLMSAAALLTITIAAPASALPLAKMTSASLRLPEPLVENVHLICDPYGRCYNSRRYVQRRYYARPSYSDYGYGPGYGYSSGYGYDPGYGYGYGYGPSISFGFGGFGHHHHHHW